MDEKDISITAGKSTLIFKEIDEAFEWINDSVELLWLDDYKSYVAEFAG